VPAPAVRAQAWASCAVPCPTLSIEGADDRSRDADGSAHLPLAEASAAVGSASLDPVQSLKAVSLRFELS
jgi:hypothetical protein